MPEVDARFLILRTRTRDTNLRALRQALRRQREAVAAANGHLGREWDNDLASLILRLNLTAATQAGNIVARRFLTRFAADVMEQMLEENAQITAENINTATRERIHILGYIEAYARGDIQAPMWARTMAGMSVNFGAREGARQGGARWKIWQVNSGNPRSSHAALSGERVRIEDTFSNGLRWPGDSTAGDAEDRANCECSMVLSD
jgi:hypothetical protein